MLESRSSYGYYGWAGGASGENKPEDISDGYWSDEDDSDEYDGLYEEDRAERISQLEWDCAW